MNVLATTGLQSVKLDSRDPRAFVDSWGIKAIYFNGNGASSDFPNLGQSPGDSRFDRDHVLWANWCEQNGVAFCVWFGVPKTGGTAEGVAYANAASKRVDQYGGASHVRCVLHDNEKVPLAFQAAYMARWDGVRPFRPTIYSVEPIQDESQNRYDLMLARNVMAPGVRKVTYQCYQGGMQPLDPYDVRSSTFGTARLADQDLCPTIDPAQPASYVASAFAGGGAGVVLFSAERMP